MFCSFTCNIHTSVFVIQEEFSAPMIRSNTGEMSRDQLVNKLNDLQAKKTRMDDMLKELQSLRTNPSLMLNNGM